MRDTAPVNPTIRAAGPDDLPALADVAAETFPAACPPHLDDDDIAAFIAANLTAEHFAAHLSRTTRRVFVAEVGDGLVGYTLAVAEEPADQHIADLVATRPTVELSKCYTSGSARGAGVAAALLDATAAWAAGTGARSMWLGVSGLNLRAQAFYRKHGFIEIGSRRFEVGKHVEDDLVMELPLGTDLPVL